MPAQQPVIIDTLGKLLDKGYQFNMWCQDCTRGAIVSVEPFVEKLGRDHGFAVERYARCGRCGGKNIEVRIQAPQGGHQREK